MERHYGKCALCRKECDLTFEHIPPRAAFNSKPVRPVTGEQMIYDHDRMPWDTTGLPYSNQQRGMGRYSLCDTCNESTGRWYGTTYKRMARAGYEIVSKQLPNNHDTVRIIDIFPLRFIKQALSMFCSINNIDDERLAELRQFVLEQGRTGIDKTKYRLCMYFTKSKLIKYVPMSAVVRKTDSGFDTMCVSEITAFPLGLILYFNPTSTWHYDGIDITGFADCSYDEKVSIEVPICILEVNDLFPTVYRSKDEIIQTFEMNKREADAVE